LTVLKQILNDGLLRTLTHYSSEPEYIYIEYLLSFFCILV